MRAPILVSAPALLLAIAAPRAHAGETPVATTADAADTVAAEASQPEPERWQVGLGAHLAEFNYGAPNDLLALSAFLDVSKKSEEILTPSFRLWVSATQTGTITSAGGDATFRWIQAELDGCPLQFGLVKHVYLRACATVIGGIVKAEAKGTPDPKLASRPWLGVGPLFRVQWRTFEPLVLEAQAGVVTTLFRDDYALVSRTRSDDHVVLLGVDSWIPFASAGAAVVF